MESTTYEILAANAGIFTTKIDKLIAKATAANLEPMTYVVGSAHFVDRAVEGWDVTDDGAEIEGTRYVAYTKNVEVVEVTVTGDAPRLPGGYTLVGVVEHNRSAEGAYANFLRSAPGKEMPVDARTAAPSCDHCNKAIHRNETVVVESEAGELKRLGKQCVGLYLPGVDVNALMALLNGYDMTESASSLGGDQDSEFFGGKHGDISIYVTSILATAAAVARTIGWVSAAKAKEQQRPASAGIVMDIYGLNGKKMEERAIRDINKKLGYGENRFEVTEADHAYAAATIAWAQNPRGNISDYAYNLSVLTLSTTVKRSKVTFLVSAIGAYARTLELKAEWALRDEAKASLDGIQKPSDFVGTVGERRVFDVTMIYAPKPLESRFGVTYLCTFKDAEGNLLKWFASTGPDFKINESVSVKATVKAHEEFNGKKETTLTRVARA